MNPGVMAHATWKVINEISKKVEKKKRIKKVKRIKAAKEEKKNK